MGKPNFGRREILFEFSNLNWGILKLFQNFVKNFSDPNPARRSRRGSITGLLIFLEASKVT